MSELRLGDAIEIMKEYPDEFFDCVVSDIPYEISTGGCAIKERPNEYGGILNHRYYTDDRLKNKWLKQEDINDNATLIRKGKFFENIPEFSEWLPEVYRVLKEGTHCYLMINARNLKKLQTEAEKVGFKFCNLLVWVKNNQTPHKFYMSRTEYILMLRKGRERYINFMGTSNVFVYPNILGNKFHPTEKPIMLMEDLIVNSTNEGDKVLDPFMGSGSTCVACKKTNREYYGIEIDEKYYNITKKRIESEFVSRVKSKSEQVSLW